MRDMYIKEIFIKNFKKLKDEHFVFGQINAIIGFNNSGKTTLLDVLKSFLDDDITVFKNYDLANGEKIEIKLITNLVTYCLDTTKATPKWIIVENNSEEEFEKPYFNYISAHVTHEEIRTALESQVAEFVESGAEYAISEIKRVLKAFEMTSDLEETSSISEEGDKFGFNIDLQLKKAFKLDFDNHPQSIKNKGLGQQKEFVLRQYTSDNPFGCQILLVDEIENSLSIDVVETIIKSLKRNDTVNDKENIMAEEELQVFYTTHSPHTIIKEVEPNIITLGEVPVQLLVNVNDQIYCEGPTDAKVFKQFYPNKYFIPSGGSNIVHLIEAVAKQGATPKVIVDGDKAGKIYFSSLSKYLSSKFLKILSRGTIEDYVSDLDIVSVLKKHLIPISNPIQTNVLENISTETLRSNVKKDLQSKSFDKIKIKTELDSFI